MYPVDGMYVIDSSSSEAPIGTHVFRLFFTACFLLFFYLFFLLFYLFFTVSSYFQNHLGRKFSKAEIN